MMYEYLKRRGMNSMNEHEFMNKFRHFMNKYRVAINSQYHDYAELFKSWFGDGIEQRIIESAIIFWFKDADCKAENKVVEYLREY